MSLSKQIFACHFSAFLNAEIAHNERFKVFDWMPTIYLCEQRFSALVEIKWKKTNSIKDVNPLMKNACETRLKWHFSHLVNESQRGAITVNQMISVFTHTRCCVNFMSRKIGFHQFKCYVCNQCASAWNITSLWLLSCLCTLLKTFDAFLNVGGWISQFLTSSRTISRPDLWLCS